MRLAHPVHHLQTSSLQNFGTLPEKSFIETLRDTDSREMILLQAVKGLLVSQIGNYILVHSAQL